MDIRVACKLLSRVEASADASNQHEFHAGLLRKALDLPDKRTTGALDITYVLDDEADPETESCTYTLSNVREDNPKRDEFHMYYSSSRLQQLAREGDILVLTRVGRSNDLRALIARPSTELGARVKELLADTGVQITERFKRISAELKDSAAWELFTAAADVSPAPSAENFLAFAEGTFISRVLDSGKMPTGRDMAEEAGRILERMVPSDLDADTFLQWRLDAETQLFQHLEKEMGQRELDKLVRSGSADFAATTQLILRHLQSRKSRRGQSLQNHFSALLDREGIAYTAQCETEDGERPDFIFPGCNEYADPTFSPSKLRMVACKTLLRERWRQVLKEAKRIAEKYLLTVDLGVSDATIAEINRSQVRLFVPAAMRDAAYRHHQYREAIESVADLINRLKMSQS